MTEMGDFSKEGRHIIDTTEFPPTSYRIKQRPRPFFTRSHQVFYITGHQIWHPHHYSFQNWHTAGSAQRFPREPRYKAQNQQSPSKGTRKMHRRSRNHTRNNLQNSRRWKYRRKKQSVRQDVPSLGGILQYYGSLLIPPIYIFIFWIFWNTSISIFQYFKLR